MKWSSNSPVTGMGSLALGQEQVQGEVFTEMNCYQILFHMADFYFPGERGQYGPSKVDLWGGLS